MTLQKALSIIKATLKASNSLLFSNRRYVEAKKVLKAFPRRNCGMFGYVDQYKIVQDAEQEIRQWNVNALVSRKNSSK